VLVDHQAADVVLLDLTPLTTFTDFFVVATAESDRQMRALVDAIGELLDEREPGRHAKWEGQAANGWQLLDLSDVVVHLFSVEKRAYYDLEGLWSEAREVVHIQ
jgi:ribosome-associated protein